MIVSKYSHSQKARGPVAPNFSHPIQRPCEGLIRTECDFFLLNCYVILMIESHSRYFAMGLQSLRRPLVISDMVLTPLERCHASAASSMRLPRRTEVPKEAHFTL
jgi:hypothetical protein